MSNKKKMWSGLCLHSNHASSPWAVPSFAASVPECVWMCVYVYEHWNKTETQLDTIPLIDANEKSAGEMKGGYDDECLFVWFICTSGGVLELECVTKCTINSSIYMCVCASARICCDGMVYDGGRIGSRHRCSELRSFSLPAVVMRMMIMTLMMMMMMIHYEGSQD